MEVIFALTTFTIEKIALIIGSVNVFITSNENPAF